MPGSDLKPFVGAKNADSATVTRRGFLEVVGTGLACLVPLRGTAALAANDVSQRSLAGDVVVLPDGGRNIFFQVIDSAEREILIEICVLEDPQILQHIEAALNRGVAVRVIVDFGKYTELAAEREHLRRYLTSAGGELHLSNPVFPEVSRRSSSSTQNGSSMAQRVSIRRHFESIATS